MQKTPWIAAAAVLAAVAIVPFAGQAQAPATGAADLLPPNAKPGECYARVWVPAQYETKMEKVVQREASQKLGIVPAKFETTTEKVLVKEAYERLEVVPAKFEWVDETVTLQPASKRIVEVPAVYETVQEKVVDTPEHTVWKKGRGPIERVEDGTGEIMCLVTIPASYKIVNKRVLKSPPTTKETDVPAKSTTVRKRVVKEPATVKKVQVPAEYKTIQVRKMVQPATVQKTEIPAQYTEVPQRTLVREGHMEWRPVLCETNTTSGVVTKIQRGLQSAGYNPGPIDGVIGTQTREALRAYQRDKGLAVGGLTAETLRSLGVSM